MNKLKLASGILSLVMVTIFFLIITPIGLIMRIMGKDLLNKKYDKRKETYWIKRNKPIGSMKRQF